MVFYLKQSVLASLALSFGMVKALTGEATWYTPNGGLGACGAPIQNSEHIVALSSNQYVAGSSCGRRIRVNYKENFVVATVGDLCPGCGPNGLDLTSSAFETLTSLDDGRILVTWHYE
ncbi:riboflavine-aldehyde-forming enzyme [Armillaria mellea]|nr:riboflavine-aldehyde-forming enzyme [Armillaria mellea]